MTGNGNTKVSAMAQSHALKSYLNMVMSPPGFSGSGPPINTVNAHPVSCERVLRNEATHLEHSWIALRTIVSAAVEVAENSDSCVILLRRTWAILFLESYYLCYL